MADDAQQRPVDPLGEDTERVAKALCQVAVENARKDFGNDKITSTYGWRDWLPDARAALAALARPSPPVDGVAVDAVAKAIHAVEDSWNDHDWEQLTPSVQESFRVYARAALEAAQALLARVGEGA